MFEWSCQVVEIIGIYSNGSERKGGRHPAKVESATELLSSR